MMVYWLNNDLTVGNRKTISLDLPGGYDDRLIEVVDSTADGGLYVSHGRALVSGKAVKTELFPKYMKARSSGVIADFASRNNLKYVSNRFRSTIEDAEPGIHQFVPFQIVGSGKKIIANMFFMNICNRLDSMDRTHTTLVLDKAGIWLPGREVPADERPADYNPNAVGKFVFNLNQIGGRHLWYDKHSIYGPYLSDSLADALQQEKLTGFTLVQGESV